HSHSDPPLPATSLDHALVDHLDAGLFSSLRLRPEPQLEAAARDPGLYQLPVAGRHVAGAKSDRGRVAVASRLSAAVQLGAAGRWLPRRLWVDLSLGAAASAHFPGARSPDARGAGLAPGPALISP